MQLNAPNWRIYRPQMESYRTNPSAEHPYVSTPPFEGKTSSSAISSIGGDPAEVYLFWGDERIEVNSTITDPQNNSTWDYKLVLSDSSDIGILDQVVTSNLVENTDYYYRAYAKNLAGETWADQILTFRTIDTQFTKDSLDGLVLWLDASDIDGNGLETHLQINPVFLSG